MKVGELIKALQESPNMDASVSFGRAGFTAAGAAVGDLFTISAGVHGLAAGDQVVLRGATSGAGITVGTPMYVRTTGLTTTVFGLSTTGAAGTLADVTTDYVAARFDKVAPAVVSPAAASLPADAPNAAVVAPGILVIG